MRTSFFPRCTALAVVAALAVQAHAGIRSGTADKVLGQPDFTSNSPYDGRMMNRPEKIACDPATGRIYVLDTRNSRVLWWNNAAALASGTAAAGLIGQAGFGATLGGNRGQELPAADTLDEPAGICTDTEGNLWVADTYNNRVLKFAAPITSGMQATLVLGHESFTGRRANDWDGDGTSAVEARSLSDPSGVAVDSAGTLWVADTGNHRALRFSAPVTNARAADLVLGQTDFVSNSYDWSSASAAGMSEPSGIAVDAADNVWIADPSYCRVTRYSAPSTNGQAANLVLGQATLTGKDSGTGDTGLAYPRDVRAGTAGRIWVVDSDNSRVLRYTNPDGNGAAADLVLGQADFAAQSENRGQAVPSADSLRYPAGAAVDARGDLWIADNGNNRVLRYIAPAGNGQAASIALGQRDLARSESPWVAPDKLAFPVSAAVDPKTGRLYVADATNCCVRWWDDAAARASGAPADGTLGTPVTGDRKKIRAISGFAFSTPTGIAVAGDGTVWVTDYDAGKAYRFSSPVADGATPDLTLGSQDIGYALTGVDAASLNAPVGIDVDLQGRIWIADSRNNRVLRFSPPFTDHMAADLVLGQTDFDGWDENRGEGAPSAGSLCEPYGVIVADNGTVWVADYYNNRALRYTAPTANGQDADLVLGQPDFVSRGSGSAGMKERADAPPLFGAASPSESTPPTPTAATLSRPTSLVLDMEGALWVADSLNNRVLRYTSPSANGQEADFVIGQADFVSNGPNRGAAVIYDLRAKGSGNYKGDSGPSVTTLPADNTLCMPVSLAFDTVGGLWVADAYNCRALYFRNFATGTATPPTGTVVTGTTRGGEVRLEVPTGTFARDVVLTIAPIVVPAGDDTTVRTTPVGVEITNDQGLQPDRPMTITLSYRDEDVAGLDEAKIVVARLDTASGRWLPLPSTVYPTENRVVGRLDHLSQFALVMPVAAPDLRGVRIYPNPYRPARHMNGVKIEHLTAEATVRIFTVTGELVRTLDYDTANGLALWDGRNDAGRAVASGIYLVFIDGPSGTKKMKIAVER